MAPIAVEAAPTAVDAIKASLATTTLDDLRAFASFDNTPSIGTEFSATSNDARPVLDITAVLASPAKLAALARLVSERGVVFFRNAKITPEEQKVLVQALGEASGKPSTSGLHVHPLTLEGTQYGDEITHISNQYILSPQFKNTYSKRYSERRLAKTGWHSDITFENVPSDYASLVLRDIPAVGGDTLWASAYEAYDRLSPALQTFLEGLTALHKGVGFLELQAKTGLKLRDRRGAPENVGSELEAIHPVIRTNPVTGWKGLFVNREFTQRIIELTIPESDALLDFLYEHISANHDLQVRFRWEKDSLAIWDNRSTQHSATTDIENGQVRNGTRSVSLGERPFFDPTSKSRRADLAERAK